MKNLKIRYIDHHLSHISSAFYPSGFENCLAISIDGFGDFSSLVVAQCSNQKIRIIKNYFFQILLEYFMKV